MRRILTVLFALVVLVGFANDLLAQSSTRPGFSTSVRNTIQMPNSKTGIVIRILDNYGKPVRGAELVVSPMKRDQTTYEEYEDLGSAKRYGQCTTGTSGCVQVDGVAEIQFSMLPLDNSGQWADIVVRAEAPNGFIHGIWDMRRVQVYANGRPEYMAPIYMYNNGVASYQTRMWWKDDAKDVFVISTLVWSPFSTDVTVGISFKGSSYTKSVVEYGQANLSKRLDQGYTQIEYEFYAPKTDMGPYNGALCGKFQLNTAYNPEWVYESTKEVCIAEK